MPQKTHSRILKKFRGVDYSTSDLDRDLEYFKDAENVELSHSGGIRGRTGYRPILSAMGFQDVFHYKSVDINDNETSKAILVNGHLWKLEETSFSILTATSLELTYDYSTTHTYAVSGYDSLSINPFSLRVNGVNFSTITYPTIGDLWTALTTAGHTVTQPASTQLRSWGVSPTISLAANVSTFNFTSIGTLQVNDIIGIYIQHPSNIKIFTPCIICAISGTSVTIRVPETDSYNGSAYAKSVIGGNVGFTATASCGIFAVDSTAKTVTMKYPEPIPCVTHFTQIASLVSSAYGIDHAFLGYPKSPTGDHVDYVAINTSESLFVLSDKLPPMATIDV